MNDEYQKRIELPLDRDLIWIWSDKYHFRRNRKHTNFKRESYFTFDIPEKVYTQSILWSDFLAWHGPLNHLFDETEEEIEAYEEIFLLPDRPEAGTVQGVTTRLHKDWVTKVETKKKWFY